MIDRPHDRTVAHTTPDQSGQVVAGRYKLLEEIGEGGMGTVWMAQQTEPVKRLVAVKFIKPGMDSRQVMARFEAERQALAMMDHPNIARVFDAGVAADGRPFFVMELVKGVPITRFCDERKLTTRDRLGLFIPVCQAIQHAHQKGVIHRDLKPNNVLVALYDDRPVPKVIDFGVAKAATQQLTDLTLHTGFGAVVGTPEYMSPEQASFNNLDIDTRSDVYSLGVLLYELLTGGPPFSRKELEQVGQLEIFRAIRETEPPRPSTRLSTADALPSLAANRSTEPKKLTRLLRSELDWVVMKALEKDRNRRYETANGFAADIQRYLSGEPVQAVPPSAGYRLRKFVRKNRGPVVGAGVVFAALVLGVAGATIGLISADKAREAAETAERNERTERTKADAARKDADEQRKQVERQAVIKALDLLDQIDDDRGPLQMARMLGTIPPHSDDLRQHLTVRLITEMQKRYPLAPDLEGTGGPAEVAADRLACTPDGRHLVGDTSGGDMAVWEAKTHRRLVPLREGDEFVTSWGSTPDLRLVYTIGRDQVARVWEVPSGRLVMRTPLLVDASEQLLRGGQVSQAWISASHLLVESSYQTDRAPGEPTLVQTGPPGVPGAPTGFPPPGGSGQPGGPAPAPLPTAYRLELWNLTEKKRVAVWAGRDEEVTAAAFSSDGVHLAVGNRTGAVRVRRTDTGAVVTTLRHSAEWPVAGTAFSPSGRWLVSIAQQEGRWWRTDTWAPDGPTVSFPAASNGSFLAFPRDDAAVIGAGTADYLTFRGDPAAVLLPGPSEGWVLSKGRLNGGRWVFDPDTRQVSRPPLTERFHTDAAGGADGGRWLATRNEIIDLAAQRRLIEVGDTTGDGFATAATMQRPVRMPEGGYTWVSISWAGAGMRVGYVPPPTLEVPADVLQLWVQVIVRNELGPGDELKPLDEKSWEAKRQELAARARPAPDFPFPGRIVTDRYHWLRNDIDSIPTRDPQNNNQIINAARVVPLLDRLLAAEPTGRRHLERATLLESLGRWQAAADDYLAAYRLDDPAGPNNLDAKAWGWVKLAGRPAEEYQAGVRLAEAARKQRPEEWSVINTLGVAHYRAGRYRDAVAALRESRDRCLLDAFARQVMGPRLMSPLAAGCADPVVRDTATNVAFLAMAHARLGEAGEARTRMAELRAIMAAPNRPTDPEILARVQEAGEVVEGKPAGK